MAEEAKSAAAKPAQVALDDSFDLEAHISAYSGHSKIARLLFILERCPDLAKEGLPLLENALKEGTNTAQYRLLFDKYGAELESLGVANDQAWVSEVDKQAEVSQGKLENQLSTSKSGTSKEATRVAHVNMGDFWYGRGDIPAALKCYTRARDYCSTPEMTRNWCLDVIKCHITLEQFHSISSYVAKAENQESAERRGVVDSAKLKVCSALSHMMSRSNNNDCKNYRFAAKCFLQVSTELGSNYDSVISVQDVAIYGGLCALATLDRSELIGSVLKSISFKQFLEKVPEMNEMLQFFKNSNYAEMLKIMEDMRTTLMLDIHMSKHVETLFNQIRNRAMVQYFTPYSAVNLHQMATAFDRDISTLEKELAVLISDGSISGRIDSHNKILMARSANIRSTTFKAALDIGSRFIKDEDAMLLRASVLKHNMTISAPKKDGGTRSGRDPRGKQTGH